MIGNNEQHSVHVLLMMANSLDCDAMTQLFTDNKSMQVLAATSDFDYGCQCCLRLRPHVLIVDPKVEQNAVSRTVQLTQDGYVSNAILLDDHLREGLVSGILAFRKVSYVTRESGSRFLLQATRSEEHTSELQSH